MSIYLKETKSRIRNVNRPQKVPEVVNLYASHVSIYTFFSSYHRITAVNSLQLVFLITSPQVPAGCSSAPHEIISSPSWTSTSSFSLFLEGKHTSPFTILVAPKWTLLSRSVSLSYSCGLTQKPRVVLLSCNHEAMQLSRARMLCLPLPPEGST